MVLETDRCEGRIAGVWMGGMQVALSEVLLVMMTNGMVDIEAAVLIPSTDSADFIPSPPGYLTLRFLRKRPDDFRLGREAVQACLSISLGVSFGSSG